VLHSENTETKPLPWKSFNSLDQKQDQKQELSAAAAAQMRGSQLLLGGKGSTVQQGLKELEGFVKGKRHFRQ
jgi:hypothetical protein